MTYQEFKSKYTYKIREDYVGSGSFSKVYRAQEIGRHHCVAIKISQLQHEDEKKHSLEEEFKVIKDLPPHDNIAYYEDVLTNDTNEGIFDYIIMEYYPYGSLSKLIEKEALVYEKSNTIDKTVSFEEKEKIATEILKGLAFLHDHKRMHRDLKPSNILIDYSKKTKKITPLITDFGLSKIIDGEKKSSIENSLMGGTIAYSSPEQIRGEQKIDFNTDLWSYGVVVYELLTGNALFYDLKDKTGSYNQNEITNDVLNLNIAEKLQQIIPEKWREVLEACLVKDPKVRVKSASQLFSILNSDPNNQMPTADYRQNIKPIEGAKSNITGADVTEVAVKTTKQLVTQSYDLPPPVVESDTDKQNFRNLINGAVVGAYFSFWLPFLKVYSFGGTRLGSYGRFNAFGQVWAGTSYDDAVLFVIYSVLVLLASYQVVALFTRSYWHIKILAIILFADFCFFLFLVWINDEIEGVGIGYYLFLIFEALIIRLASSKYFKSLLASQGKVFDTFTIIFNLAIASVVLFFSVLLSIGIKYHSNYDNEVTETTTDSTVVETAMPYLDSTSTASSLTDTASVAQPPAK